MIESDIRYALRSAMNNVANAVMAPQSGGRTLRALIAAEFALATLLLICVGLLLRADDRVRHVDPGFNADGVLTFSISLGVCCNGACPINYIALQFSFFDRPPACGRNLLSKSLEHVRPLN
jgi:hypothetical protein